MKNILKIIFLGVVGFALLVFLTIPKENSQKIENSIKMANNLPKNFEIIAKDFNKNSLFLKNSYIIVLNHDSLAVFKELYKRTDKNITLIANISKTPWLIKNIAVDKELENMYKDSKIPLINDSNGSFRQFFSIKDDTINSYFVYKVLENNQIEEIYKGFVKKGALQDGILIEEINKDLDIFLNNLK